MSIVTFFSVLGENNSAFPFDGAVPGCNFPINFHAVDDAIGFQQLSRTIEVRPCNVTINRIINLDDLNERFFSSVALELLNFHDARSRRRENLITKRNLRQRQRRTKR